MEVGHLVDGFVGNRSLQMIVYQNLQWSQPSVFPVDRVEIMLHYCYSPKFAEISDLTSCDC